MSKKAKSWITIGIFVYLLLNILLFIFMPTSILANPLTTPSAFLGERPSLVIFDRLTIIVPSSTLFVYLLGIQILYIGYRFIKENQRVWGVSLLFWGLGTLLAGTSYQGLGYELKCNGLTYCQFTSWFELSYLLATAISISLMGFAFAKQFTNGKTKIYLKRYSEVALFVYIFILLLGSILSNHLLISYEIFSLFFMPLFLVFFVLNIINYKKNKDSLNKSFILLWLLFLFVNVAYYAYYIPGFTQTLYTNTGIWFSANDVLHVGLMIWFFYFYTIFKKDLFLKE